MKTNRWIPPAAMFLSAFLLLTGSSPASAADEVKLDQPAASKAMRIAILPIVNGTSEIDAVKILEDVMKDRFKELDRSKGIFLMPSDVERVLGDSGSERAWRLTDRWSKSNAIDSTAIGGLDSTLLSDAVLLVKISEWETKRFHNIGEGQSYSTVGLHFALYTIRDKRKIWSKDVREQRQAREYDVASGTVGYDATGRIQSPSVNEPPRIQEVASDLVRDALKKFPNK